MIPPKLMFTNADSSRAHREWGANCGPHALAAAIGFTLDQVRGCIPAHCRGKGMKGADMEAALTAARKECWLKHGLRTNKLCEGINSIVWPKRWLAAGIPLGTAGDYHFIAHFGGFVYCTALPPSMREGEGWVSYEAANRYWLTEYGEWHVNDWVFDIQ